LPRPNTNVYGQGICLQIPKRVRKNWYEILPPYTNRTLKNAARSAKPLTSWKVVPVRLVLSKNQWMFRKKVLISQRRQRVP
jgi:hypothetical protein